jgi:hypothetical protein
MALRYTPQAGASLGFGWLCKEYAGGAWQVCWRCRLQSFNGNGCGMNDRFGESHGGLAVQRPNGCTRGCVCCRMLCNQNRRALPVARARLSTVGSHHQSPSRATQSWQAPFSLDWSPGCPLNLDHAYILLNVSLQAHDRREPVVLEPNS